MNLTLLVGVACAILFFRAAHYERMSPWAWTAASVGLTEIVSMRTANTVLVLLGQVALFAVMWWYNARRQNDRDP